MTKQELMETYTVEQLADIVNYRKIHLTAKRN